MAVTEFSIGCSKTINLGNYNSLRIEASIVYTLETGDDLTTASLDAQAELRRLLEQTYAQQYKHAETLA